MKKILLRTLVAVVILIAGLIGFVNFRFHQLTSQELTHPEFQIQEEVAKADVELGRRIFHVRSGCVDCHGHDLTGKAVVEDPAMGSIHGTNLTKLKDWTDEEIARAIRYGIGRDRRTLVGMPATDFERMSKGDVAAVIAYLRSEAEVDKPAHQNRVGPLAKLLAVMGQLPIALPAYAVDRENGFFDKPEEGPTHEFGRYLANSCTGCHGPELRGGKIPGGDPSWPPASNLRLGANPSYNEESFRRMITEGVSPATGAPLRMPMPVGLLKQMNEMEIKALWLYLSSLN